MTRRNRVDPMGEIVALDFLGAFMGNRGILHDSEQRIVRRQANQAWIICRLEFKGRQRELMQPGRWTELFFWDEATALAAGHRPCFECRRDDATRFRDLFRRVTGQPSAGAGDIDRRLADERRVARYRRGSGRILVLTLASEVPPGAMVLHADQPHLVTAEGLRPWDRRGYDDPVPLPDGEVALLTPVTTTRIIASGYQPLIAG